MDKLKVLVVDDASTVRKFITYALSNNFSYIETDTASDGGEAMVKLEKTNYDLVLCDLEMPHVGGAELLRWVRNHQTLNNLPFIIITSNNDRESVVETSRLGVSAYILKPLTIENLTSKLAAVIGGLNRRQHERFTVSGKIHLKFRSEECTGDLSDLSKGGLSGVFYRKDPLPQVLEKAVINLNLIKNIQKEEIRIEGIEGFVVRIEAVTSAINSEFIKIAVNFSNELRPEKELEDLMSQLKRVHGSSN